jgi:hypothetical protein
VNFSLEVRRLKKQFGKACFFFWLPFSRYF